MFERFTDHARKVMAMANQETQRMNHNQIGTEHVLMGLVKEGAGTGAIVLKSIVGDLRRVSLEIEKLVRSGPDMVTEGKLPQTPQTKMVIEYAIEEARKLNHNYIGTEHLLLGLLLQNQGPAAQVLMNLGVRFETVRERVLDLFGQNTNTKGREGRGPMSRRIYGNHTDAAATRTEVLLCRCVDALPWAAGLITTGGVLLVIAYAVMSVRAEGARAVWLALLLIVALLAWLVLVVTVLLIERHLRSISGDPRSLLKRRH